MSKAAVFNIDYEKLHREKEQRERELLTHNNKYGYKINVNNAVLRQIYEAFIKEYKIYRPPSEKERFIWETAVQVYLCAAYKVMYRSDLVSPVIGWQLERLEECVRCMDVPEASAAVLKLTKEPKVISKAEESYRKAREKRILTP